MPDLVSWFRGLLGSEKEELPAQPAELADSFEPIIEQVDQPPDPASPVQEAAPSDAAVQRRFRSAAESLADNEGLTGDLLDDAASALLDWGIANARRVTGETADMEDAAADEMLSPRLSANRQMLRATNHWLGQPVVDPLTPDADLVALQKIVAHAAQLFGPGFVSPDIPTIQQFLQETSALRGQPVEMIAALRRWLELMVAEN